jgi:hypothetical protein
MAAREPNCVPCLWPEQAVRYRFTVNGCPIRQCISCGLGHAEPGDFEPTDYSTAGHFNGSHSSGYAYYI